MVTEHTSPWMKSTHFTKRLLEIGNKLLLELRMGCLFDLHSRWIYNNNNNVYINITLDVPKNNLRSCFHTKFYFPQYDCRRRFFTPSIFYIIKYVYICWIYICTGGLVVQQQQQQTLQIYIKKTILRCDLRLFSSIFFFLLGLKWINFVMMGKI